MSEPREDLLTIQPTSVAKPPSPWVVPMAVGGVAIAGIVVFAAMSAGRAEKAAPVADTAAAFAPAPPPLDLPEPEARDGEELGEAIEAPHIAGIGETLPRNPGVGVIPSSMSPMSPTAAAAMGTAAARQSALDQRRRAPSMVVDLSAPVAVAATGTPAAGVAGNPSLVSTAASGDGKESDEGFARRLASQSTGPAQSSRIAQPHLTAPQGTVVPAVLETAINSDLPGFVRAVVTRDVRAFDGTTVVIPRGAKLVGQYRNAVAAGQSRAFVVWTRLIRPDGVTIDLASPGADALGRGGLEGKTDQHFLQRFGAAILLSVVSAATSRDTGGGTVVIGNAEQASRIAEIALQKQIEIPPTIKVPQGAPIRVFVARDLVFESAARR